MGTVLIVVNFVLTFVTYERIFFLREGQAPASTCAVYALWFLCVCCAVRMEIHFKII